MSVLFLIQFIIVLVCILLGAQAGGIGLGVFGGLGLAILTFGFGLEPTSPPIDVMLMMMAVVAAASAMQAAGGLDLMVKAATKLLRKNPKYITFMAPAVTYIFTIFAGTGHVAYSVLPVIAEVARRNGIRPERPLSMAVIASQFSIVASPIAAAVTSAVSYLTPYHLSIGQILIVTMPSTVLGIAIACIFVNKMGKELKDDPEYQRRLKDPAYQEIFAAQVSEVEMESSAGERSAKISLFIFICAAVLVVILGSSSAFRPAFAQADGTMKALTMPHTIEIVMLTAGALIIMLCKPDGTAITRGSVFHAGMRAAMAIFGVAWLGDTLFNAHLDELKTLVSGLVETAPWTFAFALFAFSVLVNSQGATVATLFPLGVSLGIPPEIMVGTFVAVNGYFFIPNYGPIIASIDFDTTGTTRIGRYILNHSFMIPGLLSMAFSLVLGLAFAKMLL
ncbi:Anaerobic C4-dicarboxylate membrane transporter DcuA [Cardiobacterium hominis]|uniref:C4-dicarboxylate transporter n=1 Tax=Cardiobacterium hominis TaxID=2718 RepID=A0A1C3H7G8_9GAMM|nr:anaerobic C4-dicarboxylate transporter [Cardiobacterium hominis]SAM72525.1 Anaerobic C4-dicarboxylate membrane transporter DcuA [Cardiobacterium hominis]